MKKKRDEATGGWGGGSNDEDPESDVYRRDDKCIVRW